MPSYTIESVKTGRFVSPQSQGLGTAVITESNPVGKVNFSDSLEGGVPTTIQNLDGLYMAIGSPDIVVWAMEAYFWNFVHSQDGYHVTTTDGLSVWFHDSSTAPGITLHPVPGNEVIATYFNIF
ncbi:hypothetical protein F5887DRAFT_1077848 [Amanita rubescens]|nr:hypothetical protein F5887DRAFT_1077848 [Amanita rubescens]